MKERGDSHNQSDTSSGEEESLHFLIELVTVPSSNRKRAPESSVFRKDITFPPAISAAHIQLQFFSSTEKVKTRGKGAENARDQL